MPRTSQHHLIVATWTEMNRPMVGAKELRAIQSVLGEQLGAAKVASPAAIARVLADEGAELRHPEIIECDAQWRSSSIERETRKFKSLAPFSPGEALTLEQAGSLLAELEKLRRQFEEANDSDAIEELRMFAADVRRHAEITTRDRTRDARTRMSQKEIAEWIKVWLQTPAIFADWLDLRRRSADFQKRFSAEEV